MCRYGFKTYKSHFACFNCRKTFKQAPFTDLLKKIGKAAHYRKLQLKAIQQLTGKQLQLLADIDTKYRNREIKCPECGNLMADLGLDFKSPPKTAVKEWRIIEGLYTIGKCFYSCGCNGIGYIPQNSKDYEAYLHSKLTDYEASIVYYQNKTFEEYQDKNERINYWNEKVAILRSEIKRQNF